MLCMKNVKINFHNRILMFLLLLAVMVIFTAGCGNKEKKETTEIVFTTEFAENEVFRIDTISCFVPEVNVYVRTTQNQYETIFGSQIFSKRINGQTLERQLKDIILGRLAQIKTMALLANSYGIVLTEEEQKNVSEAALAYMSELTSIETAQLGVDQELIEKMYTEYALANKVFEEVTKDVNPEISDDEARSVTVKTILFRTYHVDDMGNHIEMSEAEKADVLAKAEKVDAFLKEGEDFDSLALKYSDDDQITYSFGRGEMSEEIEKAAFNLDNGEISRVVESEFGYHILCCENTFDREETELNKARIVQKRKEEAFNEVYNEFVKTLFSNLNEELWNSLDYDDPSDVTTTRFFDVYNEHFTKN